MRRLLYLFALSAMTVLMLASAAVAQDVDCPQLSQEEAQAILAGDPSDPNRLDQDNDGLACEDNAPSGQAEPKEQVKEEPKEQPKEKAKEKEKAKQEAKKEEKKEMPKTGGPGNASLLALGAGSLLVGGGLLVRRMAR